MYTRVNGISFQWIDRFRDVNIRKMRMKIKKEYLILLGIFILALLIRIMSVYPANTIVGFDQARDFFDSQSIVADKNIRIIGPTAGNNPNLHHGVAFLYYLIPPIFLGGGNPLWIAIWNCFVNATITLIVYFFAKSLFETKNAKGKKEIPIIAALVIGVSYYYVQYAGWLSNPTVTLFTTPIFFYGIWEYYKGKKWGLPVSLFFLGLSIEFELFMLYLIPTFLIAWLILRPKLPSLKVFLISILSFTISVSTMILTEIKYNFAGVKSILFAGNFVGGEKKPFITQLISFLELRWETFTLNLFPNYKSLGIIFGVFAIIFLIYEICKDRSVLKRNLFLLLIFFSPAIMLIIGIHNAPWFLIGRPASTVIISAYLLSKIKPKLLLVTIILFIIFANLNAIKAAYGHGQPILEPDDSAILSHQIDAIEYTYEKSGGSDFAVDTVTNPLYINAVWAWNYEWISKNHSNYKPGFLGGDQKPPYNTLPKASGKEKYFFLIMDKTIRIPEIYRTNAINSIKKNALFIEEKDFQGISVSTWKNVKSK